MKDSTIILAFDTATLGCSVGLYQKGKALCEDINPKASGQAEILVPHIEALVLGAGLEMTAIDALAVTTGPGSFTGVRIGLITAQALAFALKIPLYGFLTFDVIAHGLRGQKAAKCVVVESKRADLYMQFYDAHDHKVGDAFTALPQDVPFLKNTPYILAGDAAFKVYEALKDQFDLILSDLQSILPSALAALALEAPPQAGPIIPFYLRGADVTV